MVKISACVIVKNEAKNIQRYLNCVKKLTDEVVVVDTGSTDDTVKIALENGARVEYFKWIDDFSAAKNFALDQITGDWVLILDADEYFPAKDIEKVRAAIEKYHPLKNVLGLLTRLVNIDADNNNAYLNEIYQIRIIRNQKDLRFINPVHEHLQYQGEGEGKMQYAPEISIFHTGYSPSLNVKKCERNLKILKAKVSAPDYEPRSIDDYYLADCYYALKNYEMAIVHARKFLEQYEPGAGGADYRPASILMQCLVFLHRDEAEIKAAFDKIVAIDQRLEAEMRFIIGYDVYRQRDYLRAEEILVKGVHFYERNIELGKLNKGGSVLWTDNARSMANQVYLVLGNISRLKKNDAEALRYYEGTLAINRYSSEALKNIFRILKGAETLDMVNYLSKYYDKKEDAAFILRALPKTGFDELRLYYLEETGNVSDILRARLGGDYELAARLALGK